ncbi:MULTISPECIES: molybdate ABC transporter substrate-binding protein [unclassified Rothia (in: high G+C Gram-positive bacteria)]|uniref:molybdate ABC transporter substrate-binding protein n=1 Tax=unclassified Rothia (in: high G+C Gram-positive bacteria) TaxID=2689056 RepID=UPI001955FBC3|nr:MULTISPECIES: molybdate ABC transporter substrate-binding protein [unclassified Rothia (in: high G+C Gram-positive bacteria)]MBM7051862.1 molybdate ABC transporter substrate-binding protein [Rothia sp. ZJ1223]QRZ62057.1 molybdate ABC transporter substrate-binding protein [Rothia sp. ZJ932]
MPGRAQVLFATLGLTLLSACTPSSDPTANAADSLVIFAPASLADAGAELEKSFEASHHVEIEINYAGTPTLIRQLTDGARTHILMTADDAAMESAQAQLPELSTPAQKFAGNRLVLATAPGNPAGISAVTDLSQEGVLTGICASDVPCGRLATTFLESQQLELSQPVEETSVAKVATKVATAEIDAGFIYTTDAQHLSDSTVITLEGLPSNTYSLALMTNESVHPAADDFAQWITGDVAQDILSAYGFERA